MPQPRSKASSCIQRRKTGAIFSGSLEELAAFLAFTTNEELFKLAVKLEEDVKFLFIYLCSILLLLTPTLKVFTVYKSWNVMSCHVISVGSFRSPVEEQTKQQKKKDSVIQYLEFYILSY